MRIKIDEWATNGGNKAKLWEQVKDADQREGVVIVVHGPEVKTEVKTETMGLDAVPLPAVAQTELGKQPRMTKQKERELDRLRAQLDSVVQLRDVMKSEMEIILWRVTLTQLASERAEGLDECGWDQRLCMDDEDYAEAGVSVLESYGDARGGDDQIITPEVDGEWWCRGKKKCDRHAG
jgi:COMPASS component SPP1